MTYDGSFILWKHDDEETRIRHGLGVMKWQDGREYRGQFALDKMQGEGTMTWPNGGMYVGQYHNNDKHGVGKLTIPNGASFQGNWCEGNRHGEILYLDPEGCAFRQEYNMGKLVHSESDPSYDGWTLKRSYDTFIHCEEPTDAEEKEAQCSKSITCCICLNELSDGETYCRVPCQHAFHKECIDRWTIRKDDCPLCLRKIPFCKVYESLDNESDSSPKSSYNSSSDAESSSRSNSPMGQLCRQSSAGKITRTSTRSSVNQTDNMVNIPAWWPPRWSWAISRT